MPAGGTSFCVCNKEIRSQRNPAAAAGSPHADARGGGGSGGQLCVAKKSLGSAARGAGRQRHCCPLGPDLPAAHREQGFPYSASLRGFSDDTRTQSLDPATTVREASPGSPETVLSPTQDENIVGSPTLHAQYAYLPTTGDSDTSLASEQPSKAPRVWKGEKEGGEEEGKEGGRREEVGRKERREEGQGRKEGRSEGGGRNGW